MSRRVCLLSILAGVLCAFSAHSTEVDYKIGVAAPLTGGLAHLGIDLVRGVQLAIDDANRLHPVVNGMRAKFSLVVEDDGADPIKARSAAQNLLRHRLIGVVGHLNSGATISAAKIYNEAGVVQIAPAATNPKYTKLGYDSAFRLIGHDGQLGGTLGRYAVNDLKGKAIAIIDDRTAYGQGVADEFEKGVKAAGGKVVGREYTTDKATDFAAILTSIKGKKPDVVFYGGMDAVAGPMLRQMKQVGINAKFMGGDGICTTELPKLAGDALGNGTLFCAEAGGVVGEYVEKDKAFRARFQKEMNAEVKLYAPYAYDAARLLIAAVLKTGSKEAAEIIQQLRRESQAGVTGLVNFDLHGDLTKPSFTIYSYHFGRRGLVGVDASSSSRIDTQANFESKGATLPNLPRPHVLLPNSPENARPALRLVVSVSPPNVDGIVTFMITTNGETASLTINGDEEGSRKDGRYSARRFAQVGDNRFEVVATDRFGITQRESIAVHRSFSQTAPAIRSLNPLGITSVRSLDAVAIIIGIEKYRNVPAADFANRDANVFVDYAKRALGIPTENIRLLVDEAAGSADILLTIRNWLPTRVNKGKTDVYLFYSGHGLPSQDGNSLYFLPHEANRDLLDRTAITQSEIIEALQRTNPKSVTMFVDSCYSGQARTGETLLASARPIAVEAKQATSFPPNFTMISASAPDQISSSSPDLRHGIFSYYLMRGMEGEADIDKDRQITVAEMQTYLSENVTRRAMGMNRTQQPQVVGDQNRVLVGR